MLLHAVQAPKAKFCELIGVLDVISAAGRRFFLIDINVSAAGEIFRIDISAAGDFFLGSTLVF